MSSQSKTAGKTTGGAQGSKLDAIRQKPGLPMTGFFILQMILGFEWFWSGLAKMKMPGGFPAALPGELTDMLQSSPAWYGKFLSGVVIPHAATFGYVIEISEFLIGIAFLFGPLLWFFAWDRLPRSLKIALFSLTAAGAIGGFFMGESASCRNESFVNFKDCCGFSISPTPMPK